jgi:hypothetical protein
MTTRAVFLLNVQLVSWKDTVRWRKIVIAADDVVVVTVDVVLGSAWGRKCVRT